MKKLVLVIVFILIATFLFSQEIIEKRGFYFGIGGGPAVIKYPEPTESMLNELENTIVGLQRIQLEIDLTIGWAINDKTYLVGVLTGFADRLEDSTGSLQLNTYLYAIGLRYYPFTTGLLLGGDLGASKMLIQNSAAEDSVSDFSYGYNLIAAYDFDSTKTGFTFQLGVKVGGYEIEGEVVTGVCLFGDLVWK